MYKKYMCAKFHIIQPEGGSAVTVQKSSIASHVVNHVGTNLAK